jgi:hypothetical protein
MKSRLNIVGNVYLIAGALVLASCAQPTSPDGGTSNRAETTAQSPVGEVKWIKWNADDLRPIRTESLTDTQLERIRNHQKFFVEVDEQSVDEWIDNFKRVPNPDQELAERDRMRRAYASYCAGREVDSATKKEVYRVVCLRGLLTEPLALNQLEQLELKRLPKDDAIEIIKSY